jgi:hypothetical protein
VVALSEWDWFRREYDAGMSVLFARAARPEQVIEAFGDDPDSAERFTLQDANDEDLFPCLRAGQAGGWAFGLDSGCADVFEFQQIAGRLSAGTEVVTFEINAKLKYFRYYADGDEVTSFEPLLSRQRNGSDPDRFLPQMAQAGLLTAAGQPTSGDPAIALLDMLTLAFGIRLSEQEADGPLLTTQPQLSGPMLAAYRQLNEIQIIEIPDGDWIEITDDDE